MHIIGLAMLISFYHLPFWYQTTIC